MCLYVVIRLFLINEDELKVVLNFFVIKKVIGKGLDELVYRI